MRYLLFILSISVMPVDAQLTGQLWGTALHNYPLNLKGGVKEIRYINYWARQEGGEIIRGELRDPKTNPGFFEKYDRSGIIMSAGWLDNGGNINTDFWYVKTKIKDDTLTKASYYLKDTLRLYALYTCNNSRISEVRFFDPSEDTLMMKVAYSYNISGARTGWQEYGPSGQTMQYVEFLYDKYERLETVNQYSGDGKLNYSEKLEYDDSGEWRVSHMVNHINGLKIDHEHRYEYDKHGNWIRRITYQPPKTLKMIERKIKY